MMEKGEGESSLLSDKKTDTVTGYSERRLAKAVDSNPTQSQQIKLQPRNNRHLPPLGVQVKVVFQKVKKSTEL